MHTLSINFISFTAEMHCICYAKKATLASWGSMASLPIPKSAYGLASVLVPCSCKQTRNSCGACLKYSKTKSKLFTRGRQAPDDPQL